MTKEHHLIYISGLGDHRFGYDCFVSKWRKYGLTPHLHRIGWHNSEDNFQTKLSHLVAEVRGYQIDGALVSILGSSAGASAALNALVEEPNIHAVVNGFGRLRAGVGVKPTLEEAARFSPSFRESVLLFEEREPDLSTEQRRKVLTLTPKWDEFVPRQTVSLPGADNTVLPTAEHLFSGFLLLTLFAPVVINFINSRERS